MSEFKLKATFASLPRTVRGQPIVINGSKNGDKILYCNGSNVYIRNVQDSSVCDVYTEHSKDTTVAKYSPSGFYIASGDITGKVRVWDTVNPEHILKIEHSALSGAVRDIDWTMDNSRLAIVGEGRETFGRVITYDSGNSAGEISGHSKSINSVAVKQNRPMRIATGSEDFQVAFFEGPPFKFSCSKNDHANFVNTVRYSPDGEKFVSGSADGKLIVYDGKTGETIGELGEPKAHKGGVYAISFNTAGDKLLSVSGDKTAKIWDMATKSMETEFVFGKDVNDMQVGCLWQNDVILTVSLSGYINYLDPVNPSQPARIIKGHNKPLMALAVSQDGSRFYTGSTDGRIVSWDAVTSDSEDFKGKGHTNQVADMVIDGDYLVSVGVDDMILFTPTAGLEYNGQSLKLDSQPSALDSRNGITVVACIHHLVVLQAPGRKLSSVNTNFEAISVSIRPDGSEVAVGTKTSLHVYSLANGTLTETRTEKIQEVNAVGYSPDGAWLAVGSKKTVRLYNLNTWEELIGSWGEQHTAKVTNLSWSPDGRRFITCSVDSFLILWEHGKFQGRKPSIKAHPLSHVNKVRWIDNNTVASAGQDSNIKLWSVSD